MGSKSLILFVAIVSTVSCLEFDGFDSDALQDGLSIYEPLYAEARFFNISGGFNNSLLGVVAIFIGGIILFELALYALDVYYMQTYSGSGYAYNRVDTDNKKYQYDSSAYLLYPDYPKYYDPYADTYRNLKSGSSLGIDKILEYLHLAHETYETGTLLLSDVNCQRRAVCEIYKYKKELGELSTRARHSLDYLDTVPYFSLPDEINEVADELLEAKESGENQEDCYELYDMCDKSLLNMKGIYDNL